MDCLFFYIFFMKFYTVNDKYIQCLKGIDNKVVNNYDGDRNYVGVVFSINEVSYYAPLTSYKIKQDSLSDDLITLFKIHERGNPNNKLGMIMLNNMIPVPDTEITEVQFDLSTPKGKMMQKQYEFISINKDKILTRAQNLHSSITSGEAKYKKISNDFSLLENYLLQQK